MKVDAADPVNHRDPGTDASCPESSTPPSPPTPGSVFLVRQENQQARRTDPAALREARRLLQQVARDLKGTPVMILAQVHALKNPSLVRLV